jgi:hypothetical protein
MDDGARHFARAVTHSGDLLRLRMVDCREAQRHPEGCHRDRRIEIVRLLQQAMDVENT